MAKIYGGRWKIVEQIGLGGQSLVFRVEDLQEPGSEYALKRLTNSDRLWRFKNEVEALERVSHPNIIRVIDRHFAQAHDARDKSYLVMPLAAGGNLGSRAASFKASLDSTLLVARKIAAALSAAHEAAIIHRDVKPENILFSDSGNEGVLLSDFGISLLHDVDERLTQTPEAVGPRLFMAPELEGGRLDECPPSVDVYSLGKLVYFMISGGVRLPRERFTSELGADVFRNGERYGLLRLLLERMIAPRETRLQSMREVETKLTELADWELRASVSPLSQRARNAMSGLRDLSAQNEQTTLQNQQAYSDAQDRRNRIAESVIASLEDALTKVADEMSVGGSTPASAQRSSTNDLQGLDLRGAGVAIIGGVTLSIDVSGTLEKLTHKMLFVVCTRYTTSVSYGVSLDKVEPLVPQDVEFVVIPVYKRENARFIGFLDQDIPRKGSGVTLAFHPPTNIYNVRKSLSCVLHASQWPSNVQMLNAMVSESVERLIALARSQFIMHSP